jgi:hypothetical protein
MKSIISKMTAIPARSSAPKMPLELFCSFFGHRSVRMKGIYGIHMGGKCDNCSFSAMDRREQVAIFIRFEPIGP